MNVGNEAADIVEVWTRRVQAVRPGVMKSWGGKEKYVMYVFRKASEKVDLKKEWLTRDVKLISSRPCIAYNTITYRLYDGLADWSGFHGVCPLSKRKRCGTYNHDTETEGLPLEERPSAYEGGPGKALLIAGCNVLQAKLEHVLYEDYNVEEYDNCFV